MVTCRFRSPVPWVRVLAPHPVILLIAILALAGPVMASEADVDSQEYYISAADDEPSKAARALSYYNTLPYDIWDTPTKITNDQYFVRVGGYTLRSTSSLLDVVRASAMMAVNNQRYTDNALAEISADLTPIQSLLNTYLPRIDTNTSSLHGDLLNIQHALGWSGSGDTIYELLRDISDNFASFYTEWVNFSEVLQTNVEQGFAGVTSRQDVFKHFWGTSDWGMYVVSGGKIVYTGGYFKDWARNLSSSLLHGLFVQYGTGAYLDYSGGYTAIGAGGIYLPELLRFGLMGLHVNLVGSDTSTMMSLLRPSSDGGLASVSVKTDNLLDALGLLGTELQNPLAKLQYVWADDDDIAIADANKPVKDEVVKDFVGDGDAAVTVGDISDIAGASSSAQEVFSGAGNISDIFVALTDGDSYAFWTQETADQIDTTSGAAAVSDEPYDLASDERYVVDDQGVVHVADSTWFDVYAYLEEASK